ncbi:hypothetical protein BH11PSE9_BH11PSE9_35330 [soil metagenome]
MQLDIFDDGRDLMLRNDVLNALERRDAGAAKAAWRVLQQEFANDFSLPALAVLIDAIAGGQATPFTDHATLLAERAILTEHIAPAARVGFGAASGNAWLLPLWRNLAERAAPLVFHQDHAEAHAAPLWLQAGNWAAAIDAVGRIESWRHIPVPLGWMTEARHRLDGLAATWPLWAELAWLAPRRFDMLTRRLADPLLDKLRKRFDAAFEGEGEGGDNTADLVWFPAWVLTEQPAEARWLRGAQASRHDAPELALRTMLELLGLERQGRHHEVIERRKILRDTNASLYASYLRTR